jgi:hypothetical protein
MQRGNPVAEGFVNFPMGSADYPMGGNGGTFVKLVVLDEVEGQDDTLAMCTGVSVLDLSQKNLAGVAVFDFLQENLAGDDKHPQPEDVVIPENAGPDETMRQLEDEQRMHLVWMRFHYPRYDMPGEFKHLSRAYRASIVMGSSGWSGYSEKKGNWFAKFDDLTPDGQALYRLMEKLNPGCPIHLLTFIDT